MQNQSSRGVLPEVVFCGCGFSGGVSVHGCDFNKVTKWLCSDRASVFVFSCGFTSFLGASSVEKTSGGLLLNEIISDATFNLFFLITYTFENFKLSVLLSF